MRRLVTAGLIIWTIVLLSASPSSVEAQSPAAFTIYYLGNWGAMAIGWFDDGTAQCYVVKPMRMSYSEAGAGISCRWKDDL